MNPTILPLETLENSWKCDSYSTSATTVEFITGLN